MIASDNCVQLIKAFEGFSAKPYKCPAGIPTIGYGATYYANGDTVKMSDRPITEATARDILFYQLRGYEDAVTRYVQSDLNQNQFDALVSFAFNLGNNALKNSTLLRKLNTVDYAGAAAEFVRWNRAAGVVLAGLTRRRKAEQALFLA